MAVSKRYQTFISSTYTDLVDVRRRVLEAVLKLKDFPAGMELFPAADEEAWSLIKNIIDNCDFYILIVAGKYGTLTVEGISFTEREYNYAMSLGIPVLAFVVKDPNDLRFGDVEHDPEALHFLEEFRNRVMREHTVRFWASDTDLVLAIYESLIEARENYDRPGWIRATDILTESDMATLLQLRDENSKLVTENERLKRGRVVPAANLAQGSDVVTIDFTALTPPPRIAAPSRISPITPRTLGKVDLTWNDIIAHLSPRMIGELPEATVYTSIEQLVRSKADIPSGSIVRVRRDILETIVTQLFALNVIQRSPQKHSVNDLKTYLTLTALGREQMIELRAIHRSQPTAAED